jgi:preprotein translocase subunit YajC
MVTTLLIIIVFFIGMMMGFIIKPQNDKIKGYTFKEMERYADQKLENYINRLKNK